MIKKIFKSIGYGLSVPFVGLALFFNALWANHQARKYKKDPNSVFLADRLKLVYKIFSKFMYIKRVKVVADGVDSLPTKQMLFIANHKSILDPMVAFKVLYESGKMGQISFISKWELSQDWYTRCVIELMDGIFIKRDDGRSILRCYVKQNENIKKGFSIFVFPEGTRVYGDEFKQFQPTTLKVAFENYIAITPMVIYGTDIKRKVGHEKKVYITALKPAQPNNFITTKPEPLMGSLQTNIEQKYFELKKKAQEESK